MKLNVRTCLSLGALLSMSAAGTLRQAQADELIYASPAAVTTRTTTIESSPGYLLEPAPVLEADTISRRTTIVNERPASTSSTTAILQSSLDNKPNYGLRIQLMTEQLDKGVTNGWVNNDRAIQLRSELADLQSQEVSVRTNGYLKVDCDTFEKQLTGFNIELSQSMENHSM